MLEVNGAGQQIGRNVYGTNLLMRQADGLNLYYMYNGHADVTALIDTNGVVRATYYYDAFGNVMDEQYFTASGTPTLTPINNNIMYAGYQYDRETELYYLNARMYDPAIARFLQEDTYRGDPNDPLSLNLYSYCANNPIRYYDPTGHYYVDGMHVIDFWATQGKGPKANNKKQQNSLIDTFTRNVNHSLSFNKGVANSVISTFKGAVYSHFIYQGYRSCNEIVEFVSDPKGYWEKELAEQKFKQDVMKFMWNAYMGGNKITLGMELNPSEKEAIVSTYLEATSFLGNWWESPTENKLEDTGYIAGTIAQFFLIKKLMANATSNTTITSNSNIIPNNTTTALVPYNKKFAIWQKRLEALKNQSSGSVIYLTDSSSTKAGVVNQGTGKTDFYVGPDGKVARNLDDYDWFTNGSVRNRVEVAGIGNTGRVLPNNLNEQMAMEQVLSNPLKGATQLPIKMTDPRWLDADGWVKMQNIVETSNGSRVNIHFVYNKITGVVDDFKFK
ncbi:UNVERIFIED_CONTAM: RHS repeat-associated protein [Acetivibrio alkalicellulosi]